MGGDFFRNDAAAKAASATRAEESANERATLQDVHERLENIEAIGMAMLRIMAEWANTEPEDIEL